MPSVSRPAKVRIFRDEAPPGAKLALGVISWSALGGGGFGVTQTHPRPAVNGNGHAAGESYGDTNGVAGAIGGAKAVGMEAVREASSVEVLETLLHRYEPHAIWLFAPATPSESLPP